MNEQKLESEIFYEFCKKLTKRGEGRYPFVLVGYRPSLLLFAIASYRLKLQYMFYAHVGR